MCLRKLRRLISTVLCIHSFFCSLKCMCLFKDHNTTMPSVVYALPQNRIGCWACTHTHTYTHRHTHSDRNLQQFTLISAVIPQSVDPFKLSRNAAPVSALHKRTISKANSVKFGNALDFCRPDSKLDLSKLNVFDFFLLVPHHNRKRSFVLHLSYSENRFMVVLQI